jgi:hypothetical protein
MCGLKYKEPHPLPVLQAVSSGTFHVLEYRNSVQFGAFSLGDPPGRYSMCSFFVMNATSVF